MQNKSKMYMVATLHLLGASFLSACGGGGATGGAETRNSSIVRGSVHGLTVDGLILRNGTDVLSVPPYTSGFSMPNPVPEGATYSITVDTQPEGIKCTVERASGTMGPVEVSSVSVECSPPTVSISTLAGSGVYGYADGAASSAQFRGPSGVAVDGNGNVYVADSSNNRIRKITPSGVVSTLAGSGEFGFSDGQGAVAQFRSPMDIVADEGGNVYVADSGNSRIRRITPDGTVSTIAGSGVYGYADGAGTSAQFRNPFSISLDGVGNIYVADAGNHRIRKINVSGSVSTLAGAGILGFADGDAMSAQFAEPRGVASDSRGNVYVADYRNHRIRKISPDGTVSTYAGSGDISYGPQDGAGEKAKFLYPYGVSVDTSGILYVADSGHHAVRKISTNRVVTTLSGTPFDGWGQSSEERDYSMPSDTAVGRQNSVFVVDSGNNRIRTFKP